MIRLTRREILEELSRLGIHNWRDLRRACRDFELYWDQVMMDSCES